MTRDDIIKLAHQSHIDVYGLGTDYTKFANALERFAALVAQHEREACAEVADAWQNAIHDPRYECDCAAAIRARGQA
jgi:hypothetical protein